MKHRNKLSFATSSAMHSLLLVGMLYAEGPVSLPSLIEFEVAAALPPPPVKPAPEPQPMPEEPEPPPPIERQHKIAPKAFATPPARRVETTQAPAPPLRFDHSQTVTAGQSGVQVAIGMPGGAAGGTGSSNGDGKARGQLGREQNGSEAPKRPDWAPPGEVYIERLPEPLSVPRKDCPAVRELGVTGTVILGVQVRKDGTIRTVRVVQGMGHGCDIVATQALHRAKFKPAVATSGEPADYELRYTYEFQLDD